MSDLQATLAAMRETLTRADADGHCRCYHEGQERECHQHGDEHARLDGDVADALRKTLNVVEAVRECVDRLGRIEFDFAGTPGSSDEPWYGLTRRLAHAVADLRALLDGEATP